MIRQRIRKIEEIRMSVSELEVSQTHTFLWIPQCCGKTSKSACHPFISLLSQKVTDFMRFYLTFSTPNLWGFTQIHRCNLEFLGFILEFCYSTLTFPFNSIPNFQVFIQFFLRIFNRVSIWIFGAPTTFLGAFTILPVFSSSFLLWNFPKTFSFLFNFLIWNIYSIILGDWHIFMSIPDFSRIFTFAFVYTWFLALCVSGIVNLVLLSYTFIRESQCS